MRRLAIDYQLVSQTCNHCKTEFNVSRGCIYKEDDLVGLYLAGMHGYQTKLVFLGIALGENLNVNSNIVCFLLKVWPTATEIQMTVTNPEESLWADEAYMGSMLAREEALVHPLIETVFKVADQITMRPPVYDYLNS